MPKIPTFPTLFDDALQLTITDLRQWGYLKPDQYKKGVVAWSRYGHKTASINITVSTETASPYLELSYTHNGIAVQYRVQLLTVPANIGKGRGWYFLCPRTGKRCRTLYSLGERFLHREAYRRCMYESQTYSHKTRAQAKLFGLAFSWDSLYEQLNSKHFRSSYAGKPTKRYTRLIKKIRESEHVNYAW